MGDLRSAILPTELMIRAKNEHYGMIERAVRTVKEKCRCACHNVPYSKYTKLMVTSLIESTLYWLNAFAIKGSSRVSDTLSPSAIVLGRELPDMNHGCIAFGSYAMVYIGTQNNMAARSEPAIALRSSNEVGGYYFMSLSTGKQIHSYHWKILPATDAVIKQVHDMATQEEQQELINNELLFEWEAGIPIE